MKEFELIRMIREQTSADARVVVGPGDDCAVLRAPASALLATADMLLEGVHFDLNLTTPRQVGRKAMAVNLSDIAAMAGRPIAALISVALPARSDNETLAAELYAGLREVADQFDTSIVGGDTNASRTGLIVAVTVLGEVQPTAVGPARPVMRGGAQPGDWILVTGPLGGSILGKHLDFTPRVREALQLHMTTTLHAMIDLSDGLASDLGHICTESGCGAVLFAEQIPIAEAARQMHDSRSPLEHALGDGEDFELAFTLSASDAKKLLDTQPIEGVTLYHVGECRQKPGLVLRENGGESDLRVAGFEHAL